MITPSVVVEKAAVVVHGRIFNERFQPARSTLKSDGLIDFFAGDHPTSSVAVEDDARSTSGPLYLNIVEDRRREMSS